MDYSLTVRKMTIGPAKGKELYVANPVCQKQRVSFEKLCERMAEDTTVGEAEILQPYSTSFVRYSTNFVRRVI